MEYIRSLRTGIMVEYPVMSTSQGTCVRIEQTSEAIRVTNEICREDARTGIENCWSSQISSRKVRSYQTRMKRYVQIIYMLSQCKDAIDNPAARITQIEKSELWRIFAPR